MEQTKESKIVYGLAILYLVGTYSVPLLFSAVSKLFESGSSRLPWLIFFIPVVLAVLNFVYLKKNKENISRETLLNCSVLIKYLLIPLYIFGGLTCLLFLLLMFTPIVFMIFVSPMLIGLMSVLGWVYMVGGSVFSLFYITKAEKEGIHGKFLSILACVFQFIYTLDVLSIVVITLKEKKHILATVIMLLVLFGGAVAGILWLLIKLVF